VKGRKVTGKKGTVMLKGSQRKKKKIGGESKENQKKTGNRTIDHAPQPENIAASSRKTT